MASKSKAVATEKVVEVGIARAAGWLFFVDDDGNLARIKKGKNQEPEEGTEEILAKTGVDLEEGYIYFVDKDGDISRCRDPESRNKAKPPRPSKAASPAAGGAMRALSIRQPWAELIMLGKKNIEYRSRPTNIRERVHVYAGSGRYPQEHELELSKKYGLDVDALSRGVLVGTVEVADCTEGAEGFEWHLRNPERATSLVKPEKHPQPGFFYPF